MVNIFADSFTQRIDRFFIERFELRERFFWGQLAAFWFMTYSLFLLC